MFLFRATAKAACRKASITVFSSGYKSLGGLSDELMSHMP
jgi:hypothetical protein